MASKKLSLYVICLRCGLDDIRFDLDEFTDYEDAFYGRLVYPCVACGGPALPQALAASMSEHERASIQPTVSQAYPRNPPPQRAT